MAGPILLEAWRIWPPRGVAFVVGFYVTFVVSLGAFIFVVGSARNVHPRVHQTLVAVAGVALAGFGLWQIGSGLSSMLS